MSRKPLSKEERIKRLEQQISQINNEPDLEVFNIRLKETLKKLNMTEIKLANRVGCTPQSINQYTTGNRIPGLVTAVRISKALNVDIGYLVGLKDRE